jgi:hypothetical protein
VILLPPFFLAQGLLNGLQRAVSGRLSRRKAVGKPDSRVERFRTLIGAHRDSGWTRSRQNDSRRDKRRKNGFSKK